MIHEMASDTNRTLKSSKSRNGCHRCKSKHIKCDETKPSCRICEAQGAECPGYAKQLRWSNKHEVYTGPPKKRQRTSPTAVGPIKTADDGSDRSQTPAEIPVVEQTPPQNTHTNGHAEHVEEEKPEDVLSWSNFEPYEFEDLTFPVVVPEMASTFYPEHFYNPFVGELCASSSQLSDSAIDASSSVTPPENFDAQIFPSPNVDTIETVLEQTDSAAGSADLLQTFYRMSGPGKVPGYSDPDLTKHFFDHICGLYSCFDSPANPFRKLVEEQVHSDRTTHYTVQAMSGVHLANFYPHMAPLGLTKRGQAWRSLQRDLQPLRSNKVAPDSVLLNLLLLGLSSAWNPASGLGLQYLSIARSLVQAKLSKIRGPNSGFFLDALMYWEMLASFVDPVPMTPLSGLKSPKITFPKMTGPRTPHPWTGVANESVYILAEIGRVLRRRYKDGSASTVDQEWTTILEKALYEITLPRSEDIVDYADPKTPKADLVAVAQAYRCIGLLEIYRCRPDLLRERLEQGTLLEEFQTPNLSVHTGYEDELDSMLATMAAHVTEVIKPINITSGACRMLPLALLIAGSQLRMVVENDSPTTEKLDEILEARYLVEQRMLVLSQRYPQRPVSTMLDIIKEVWQRAETGHAGAHWMDVTHEKAWQTMMG